VGSDGGARRLAATPAPSGWDRAASELRAIPAEERARPSRQWATVGSVVPGTHNGRMFRPLWLLLPLASCAATPLPFDLEPPGPTPQVFAPGVVSTEESIELNAVLAPDGRELFFTRLDPERRFVMHRSRLVDGRWTEPEAVEAFPDRAGDTAVDMSYAADGSELVFLGRGPGGVTDPPGLDLWRMRREGEGWSLAEVLGPPVSTEHKESYPCLVADGSLYFTSDRPGGLGESDVWRAQRLVDGSYAEPINLGAPVNTEHAEGDTWDRARRHVPATGRARRRRPVDLDPRRSGRLVGAAQPGTGAQHGGIRVLPDGHMGRPALLLLASRRGDLGRNDRWDRVLGERLGARGLALSSASVVAGSPMTACGAVLVVGACCRRRIEHSCTSDSSATLVARSWSAPALSSPGPVERTFGERHPECA